MGDNFVISILGQIKLILPDGKICVYADPKLGIFGKGIFIVADIVKHFVLGDVSIGFQAHDIGKINHIFAQAAEIVCFFKVRETHKRLFHICIILLTVPGGGADKKLQIGLTLRIEVILPLIQGIIVGQSLHRLHHVGLQHTILRPVGTAGRNGLLCQGGIPGHQHFHADNLLSAPVKDQHLFSQHGHLCGDSIKQGINSPAAFHVIPGGSVSLLLLHKIEIRYQPVLLGYAGCLSHCGPVQFVLDIPGNEIGERLFREAKLL